MVVVVVGGEVGRKARKINCLIYLSLFRLINVLPKSKLFSLATKAKQQNPL